MKGQGPLRRGLLVILSIIFIGSLAGVLYHVLDRQRGAKDYAEAAALVKLPTLPKHSPFPTPSNVAVLPEDENSEIPAVSYTWQDPYADALGEMDFSALREVNPDVLGWIMIPDTVISYPLLQGEDNEYYLKHTWKGDRNAMGSIFVESRCNGEFLDFNTSVYGHRMRGGSMFGTLKYFSKASYWEAHPYIYIVTDSGEFTYAVFSAYEAELESDTYRINIVEEAGRQAFVDYCVECSVIETGIVPTVNDHILTLSTCTGNGHATRWVVQAVRLPQIPETDMADEGTVPTPETTAEELPGAIEQIPESEETSTVDEADLIGLEE